MLLRFFLLLLCAANLFAADFVKSNIRAQVFVGAIPYYPQDFIVSDKSKNPLKSNKDHFTFPLNGGFLWNPFFTPAFKWDVPFSLWIGFSANDWFWTDLYNRKNLKNNHESLSMVQWTPTGTAGLSFNLFGNFDLRLMGGIGFTRSTFTHNLSGHPKTYSRSYLNYFAQGNLEYILVNDIFKNTDLKLGLFVQKNFQNDREYLVIPYNDDPNISQEINGLNFKEIKPQVPVKIGLEISLEFGRESRKDRKSRFKLNDRDLQLREHNKTIDTLSEWDCMAIERDYHFYISHTGELPDVEQLFTKSQFTDVLESFLAYCQPEDLKTKQKLYASLDSNKVQLKDYQMSQEDNRYRQVMASNDLSYLNMFLEYYPESQYRPNVEAKIALLGDYGNFKRARESNNFKSYLKYLADFPEGHYRKEAEESIFALVKRGNRRKDYEIYLRRFPDGMFVSEARRALHEILKQ